MLHSKFDKVNKYVIHLDGHVHPVEVVGTLVYDEEETSPLLQPSPRSKKVYVADLSSDLLGMLSDKLTHNKVYEPLSDNDLLDIVDDRGYRTYYNRGWFKEVYLYDEDETLLTCRDIELKEGDYIDLRKHTPEQIRHIAEYYKFYKLEETLGELDVEGWIYLAWDSDNEFVATTSKSDLGDKEYIYDDIFYLGEI